MSAGAQELAAWSAVLLAAAWLVLHRLRARASRPCDRCTPAQPPTAAAARGLRPRSLRVLP